MNSSLTLKKIVGVTSSSIVRKDHWDKSSVKVVKSVNVHNGVSVLFSFALVVIQPYETDVGKEYVIVGNDAIMKCAIPSFVADFVSIVSWMSSEDELKSLTQDNSQGNFQCQILLSQFLKKDYFKGALFS
jgi:hypothetical protein